MWHKSGPYLAAVMEREHDTPLEDEEEAQRSEISALLATTPRLKQIAELFRSGKSVPRQSASNQS